jgi:hypothetical protein
MVQKIRNTFLGVPRQTRPQMIVRSFRVPETVWAKVTERCEREGINPTEVVRELVTEWAEEERD